MLKVGDKVIPKTYEELIAEGWRANFAGDFNSIPEVYVNAMYTQYGGKICTVTHTFDDGVFLIHEDGRYYSWSLPMVKLAVSTRDNNLELFVNKAEHAEVSDEF